MSESSYYWVNIPCPNCTISNAYSDGIDSVYCGTCGNDDFSEHYLDKHNKPVVFDWQGENE